jgi:hypothetical protein
MSEFVKPPGAVSYAPPMVDVGGSISQLSDDYYSGANQARQSAIQNAFSGGVPMTGDGQPDYVSMARRLYQLGGFDQAGKLAALYQQQSGLNGG